MKLQKTFNKPKEASRFYESLKPLVGSTLKSIFGCYVNCIFVKVELKDSAPDQDYNYILKMFK